MIATGIAISSGHGVAITTTLRKRSGSPLAYHARPATVIAAGRVPGAELVSDATECGTPLLRVLHHPDDLREPGIGRQPCRADAQRGLSVDGPRKHLGPGALRDDERLARQKRLVHRPMPLDDLAVNRTDFVREDGYVIADGDRADGHVFERVPAPAVRNRRYPSGQRAQDGCRFRDRKVFEGVTAGEHQDDDAAGQILTEQNRCRYRNGGQMIRAEFPADRARHQPHDQRGAADREHDQERRVAPGRWRADGVAHPQMGPDSQQRQQRNPRVAVARQGRADFCDARLRHLGLSDAISFGWRSPADTSSKRSAVRRRSRARRSASSFVNRSATRRISTMPGEKMTSTRRTSSAQPDRSPSHAFRSAPATRPPSMGRRAASRRS